MAININTDYPHDLNQPLTSQQVADNLQHYLATDPDLWIKDFSLTLNLTWDDFLSRYQSDEIVGPLIKLALQIQESVLLKGALSGAYDRNIVERVLKTIHGWDTADININLQTEIVNKYGAASVEEIREQLVSALGRQN